ncbi:MAG TPA: phenylalanine--tRNA ligase subunit alpha [Tepidisphaeraceae bacterium]|jgi:phenylalanyl-tRNA synthetase alpha chain|nr:phenylalanine--tRNA ligase subunit alpha [Tepidisphaeraceae bacterium]
MADALQTIDEVNSRAAAELAGVRTADQLEQFRIRYLGSNGEVKNLMQLLKTAPADQKKVVGQKANAVKEQITAAFEGKKTELAATAGGGKNALDVTEPGRPPAVGNRHILMKVADELTDLFARMGFSTAAGPEVEDEFHNFIALNIPPQHPARDPLDNFYVAAETGEGATRGLDRAGGEHQMLLRTQTSTVQIRVMERQKPPIRVVIPGRVYRPDTVDATHLFMFHQLEALVVDKNVTMVDLKSTIMQFVRAYFGSTAKIRFRPSFFPFTEPSAEVDVWFEDKQRWIELGGCGMVHPNVFTACKIDPEVYSGWAFGFGIERIAMRKYGIDDIRHFVENDLRFLRQF